MKGHYFYMVFPFLLVMLVLLAGCNHRPPLRIGDRPQTFVAIDRYGKKLVFPDDLKGQVILVRVWAVDCPYCCKEIFKSMERLYVKYKEQGFAVVSVNVNQSPEGDEELKKIDKLISYSVLLDPDADLSDYYGIRVFPTTLILNRDGVVKEKIIGETGTELIESFIPPLL